MWIRISTVMLVVQLAAPQVPAGAQAAAPDTLRVGDPRIDGSVIEPFRVTWRGTPWDEQGRTRASNTVEETVELVAADTGPELLKFTQVWKDSLGAILFITVRVANRHSMAYRAFHTGRTPNGLGHLDFDGAMVHGFYAPRPEQTIQEFSLKLEDEPFASFAGLLFSAFPHGPELSGVLPGFGWGGSTNPAIVWQAFRVAERERVEVGGTGPMEAWRVHTSRSPGSELIFWVTKRAPYFVRAESRSANGSGSRYEIVSWERLAPADGR